MTFNPWPFQPGISLCWSACVEDAAMRCPAVPREIFIPLNLSIFLFNWGMSMKSEVYPVGPGGRTGAHFTGAGPEDRTGVCLRIK